MTNNKGFTTIEILVCLAIFVISALVLFIPQIEVQKQMINSDKKMSRVAQYDAVKNKIISSEISLKKSAALAVDNDLLCPCVLGGAFIKNAVKACTNNVCTANAITDFVLLDPDGAAVEKIAGTALKPVYFNINGGACAPSALQNPELVCSYKVISKFNAHCPGDMPTCDHADYLALTLDIIPVGNEVNVKAETIKMLYPVNLNYPPTITPVPAQSVNLLENKQISVLADPGNATEQQKFIFEQCASSDPTVFDVKCYRFVNGTGQIIIFPKKIGVGKVLLQINDGSTENNLSNPTDFSVTII